VLPRAPRNVSVVKQKTVDGKKKLPVLQTVYHSQPY